MRRLFTKRQRKILQLVAGNQCQSCSQPLDEGFHADHIKAFSKGGTTTFRNGQALCSECNLKKGAKDVAD